MPEPKLTPAERGRMGGRSTLERHGADHFKRAGRKGGIALVEKRGVAWMSELGQRAQRKLDQKLAYPNQAGWWDDPNDRDELPL